MMAAAAAAAAGGVGVGGKSFSLAHSPLLSAGVSGFIIRIPRG